MDSNSQSNNLQESNGFTLHYSMSKYSCLWGKHHEMITANASSYDNHRKSKIHIYAYSERNVVLIQSIWVLTYRLF